TSFLELHPPSLPTWPTQRKIRRQQLIPNYPEGIHVVAWVRGFAPQLLRRGVQRRAGAPHRTGQQLPPRGALPRLLDRLPGRYAADAEVGDTEINRAI